MFGGFERELERRVAFGVKYTEADSFFSEVVPDCEFDGSETFVCEGVGAGDDGEDVDARREAADDADFGGREDGPVEQRVVRRDGGLEDDGFRFGGGYAVGACARDDGGGYGRRNGGGDDIVGIEKVYTPIRGNVIS